MNEDLISVVIPVYNVEPYIAQCLDSVVEQTHKNTEIICVNDRGSDNSMLSIHQTLKTSLRQCILSMNSSKHLLDILQQTLAVSTRAIKRGKELYLTNQMRPTELKKRFRLLLVLQISREKITTNGQWKGFVGQVVLLIGGTVDDKLYFLEKRFLTSFPLTEISL